VADPYSATTAALLHHSPRLDRRREPCAQAGRRGSPIILKVPKVFDHAGPAIRVAVTSTYLAAARVCLRPTAPTSGNRRNPNGVVRLPPHHLPGRSGGP
jgi:hypothetical protein